MTLLMPIPFNLLTFNSRTYSALTPWIDTMDLFQSIFLAILQGLTEFLPISSSAHLIIPVYIMEWVDQGLAFDTAVHLGSLLAVIWYFRRDLFDMTVSVYRHIFYREASDSSRYAFNILIASLPIIPIGFFLRHFVEDELRIISVLAGATILFGLALWWADKFHRVSKPDSVLDLKTALIVGFMQCFALIPGASRSGVTMTAALLAGHSRHAAAKISFLLSIPAILGASVLKTGDLVQQSQAVDWTPILIGTFTAAVSAYSCIHLFLKWIDRIGFLPFVIYRLVLGVVLLLWFVF